MIYSEMGFGGAVAGGCAVTGYMYPFVTPYGISDILYSLPKARKGKLERVVIKSIRTTMTRRTGGVVSLYVDTLNGLWNEDELITYEQAVELAEEYRFWVEAQRARLRCR